MRAVKVFLIKIFIPLVIFGLMYIIFKPVFCRDGVMNYFLAWVILGFPFGVRHMWLWLVPTGGGSIAGSAALLVFDVVAGGLIGGVAFIIMMVKGVVSVVRAACGLAV